MSPRRSLERRADNGAEKERDIERQQVAKLKKEAEQVRNIAAQKTAERIISAEKLLKHPEVPEALTGIEGLKKAHEVLIDKREQGVVIGGLAEAVWSSKNLADNLSSHKDVDILILPMANENSADVVEEQERNNGPFENFSHGIDWWLPKIATIENDSRYPTFLKWFENGHGIILPYKITLDGWAYNRGLYVPPPEFTLTMRELGGNENIKSEADRLEKEAPQVKGYTFFDQGMFRRELRQRLKEQLRERDGFDSTLMPDIAKEFEDYVLIDTGVNHKGLFTAKEKATSRPSFLIEPLSPEDRKTIEGLKSK